MLEGRKEKFRKARRLKSREGGSKISYIRLTSKFDPDKEFYKSINITDKMNIKNTQHYHLLNIYS